LELGEVVVRVKVSTYMEQNNIFKSELSTRLPAIPGHELSSIMDGDGENITNFKKGIE